jgi:hypothetical protein
MGRGPEGRIQDYGVRRFREAGWLALKQDCGGGVHDYLMVSPRADFLWAEFKALAGKLSPIQEYFHDQLQIRINMGGKNRWVQQIVFNSREGVDDYLRKYEHYSTI